MLLVVGCRGRRGGCLFTRTGQALWGAAGGGAGSHFTRDWAGPVLRGAPRCSCLLVARPAALLPLLPAHRAAPPPVAAAQPLWGADAHVAVVDRDLRTYMGLFATPAATAMAPNMHAGMDHSSPAAMGPAMDHAAMNHGAMGGPTAEEGGQLGRRLRMAPPTPGAAQRRFGPNLETAIEFPREGVYAIIAQMRRGDDLILAPFYITCGDVDPNAAAASPSAAPAPAPAPEPSPTTSSAGVVGGAAQAAVGVVAAAALAMLW